MNPTQPGVPGAKVNILEFLKNVLLGLSNAFKVAWNEIGTHLGALVGLMIPSLGILVVLDVLGLTKLSVLDRLLTVFAKFGIQGNVLTTVIILIIAFFIVRKDK